MITHALTLQQLHKCNAIYIYRKRVLGWVLQYMAWRQVACGSNPECLLCLKALDSHGVMLIVYLALNLMAQTFRLNWLLLGFFLHYPCNEFYVELVCFRNPYIWGLSASFYVNLPSWSFLLLQWPLACFSPSARVYWSACTISVAVLCLIMNATAAVSPRVWRTDVTTPLPLATSLPV